MWYLRSEMCCKAHVICGCAAACFLKLHVVRHIIKHMTLAEG